MEGYSYNDYHYHPQQQEQTIIETDNIAENNEQGILMTLSATPSTSPSQPPTAKKASATTAKRMKTSDKNVVKYTAIHEKILIWFISIISHTSSTSSSSSSCCMISIIITTSLLITSLCLYHYGLFDSYSSTMNIILVLIITIVLSSGLILLVVKVIPFLFKEKEWETLDSYNLDDKGEDEDEDVSGFCDEPQPQHPTATSSVTTRTAMSLTATTAIMSKSKDEFYEPVTGNLSTSFYKPRDIQQMSYSNGTWKTAKSSTSNNSSNSSNNSTAFNHVNFRGVNLPAKTPTIGHEPDVFYTNRQNVSFVNTPFPLDQAAEHFQRLSNYGFNLLRLVVTWEAVMHEGPGIIDNDYINYITKLIDIASAFGLYIIIDPHQDVWSRFTGGDGAPWWTLDVAGFVTSDSSIHDSDSGFVNHLQELQNFPKAKMIWMTNYSKLASATMFTLFWGGDDYAPGVNVDEKYERLYLEHFGDSNDKTSSGVTMQQFLQAYYIQYFQIMADAVKDKRNVIGFNTMNEPSNGYIGITNLNTRSTPMPFGVSNSYLDGMKVGRGQTLHREYYSSPFYFHSVKVMNQNGVSAWKQPVDDFDIWYKVGLYSVDNDVDSNNSQNITLMKPNHFSLHGKDFMEEYMVPLFNKIQSTITQYNKNFIVYAEPFIDVNNHHIMNAPQSLLLHDHQRMNKYAWAPHWYDGGTLLFRQYLHWLALDDDREMPVVTPYFIQKAFQRILHKLKQTGNSANNDGRKLHIVLGETGVPFDISNNENNYAASTKALNRIMVAIEANLLDFTLWNYMPYNTTMDGDDWCGEDLSVRMVDRNRALLTLVRPFVYEICDSLEIVHQSFDPSKKKKEYQLKLKLMNRLSLVSSSSLSSSSRQMLVYIYLPHLHYENPLTTTSFGTCEPYDKNAQLLIWDCSTMLIDNDDFDDNFQFVLNVVDDF